MTDGVLALDSQGNITASNSVALAVLDTNNVFGKNIDQVMPLTDKSKNKVIISQKIHNLPAGFTSRNWQLRYNDGTSAYIFISVAPVRLGFGAAGQDGYVVILRDITREKSLEEERGEFISVVSHELRTPVAIAEGNISNALMIATGEGLPEPVRKTLSTAHQQILFLGNMLNDLSTLSRAEKEKINMSVEKFSPEEMIQSLIRDYRPQALAKNLTLERDGPEVAGTLCSSRLYVREILQNYITNAIKYTEKGDIAISAVARDKGVEFTVSDTGIGIGKNEHTKLFEKFFRSSDFRVKKVNGTGLGLYVTAKLAKLIAGKLSFSSQLNSGSTFRVYIPNMSSPGRLDG